MAGPLIARFEGVRRLAALAVVLSLFVACGDDGPPGGPSPPTGSYRLTGIITDATSAAPVPGAVVEARKLSADQSAPSVVRMAGPDGRYSVDKLPSVSYVRVTQYGYVEATARVELAADGTFNFSLARDPAAVDLNGAYTLTIEADDACPSAPSPLPPNLRRRIFGADIRQTAQRLVVSVGSPCVGDYDGGCRFEGLASTSGASFQIAEQPDRGFLQMPNLVEGLGTAIGDRQGLWFLGNATTIVAETGLLGSLAGTITYHPVVFPAPGPSTAGCRSGRFELARR